MVEALTVRRVIHLAAADLDSAQAGGVVLEVAVRGAVADGGLSVTVLAGKRDLVALARLDLEVRRGGARAVGA